MKLFISKHTSVCIRNVFNVTALKKNKTFSAADNLSQTSLTIGGFLILKNRPLFPWFSLKRRGYYHCQLQAYYTVVVSHLSNDPIPERHTITWKWTISLLIQFTSHYKALLLYDWCYSAFHISSLIWANLQHFTVLLFKFQVKWSNSNITLRS